MDACFEQIPGGSRVLVRPFTDRAAEDDANLGRRYREAAVVVQRAWS
jgi:hypothetical protein